MDKEPFMLSLADALGVERADLTEATELSGENWDSLAHLAFIAAIDEKFGVTVSGTELTAVRTVGDLMQLVERSMILNT